MERSQHQVQDVARAWRFRRRYRMSSGVAASAEPALATGHGDVGDDGADDCRCVSVTVPLNCPMATSVPFSIAKRLIENVPAMVADALDDAGDRDFKSVGVRVAVLRECGVAGMATNDPISATRATALEKRLIICSNLLLLIVAFTTPISARRVPDTPRRQGNICWVGSAAKAALVAAEQRERIGGAARRAGRYEAAATTTVTSATTAP